MRDPRAAARVGAAERPSSAFLAERAPDRDAAGPSYDALCRASGAHMVRLAWLLLGSQDAAEDVVRDAFAEVHHRWDRVDDPARALRRTVVGRALRIDPRRGRHRFPSVAEDPPATGDPTLDSTWEAIARLRPERRAVVVLSHWARMAPAEIAETLGCSPVTVRLRLRRALADLLPRVDR